MADATKPAVPERLTKWREDGQILDVKGRKLFVHDSGPKTDDAVFIVHGYPGSSWDFQGVVERIGDQVRTVVMDMRGFGLSEKPLEGTYQEKYTLKLQADLYEALAEQLGLKDHPAGGA